MTQEVEKVKIKSVLGVGLNLKLPTGSSVLDSRVHTFELPSWTRLSPSSSRKERPASSPPPTSTQRLPAAPLAAEETLLAGRKVKLGPVGIMAF